MRRYVKGDGRQVHSSFELIDVLGKGSFGSVYKVTIG
jgi:hypothetical protein